MQSNRFSIYVDTSVAELFEDLKSVRCLVWLTFVCLIDLSPMYASLPGMTNLFVFLTLRI